MNELKNCPLCGGKAELLHSVFAIGTAHRVACTVCRANTGGYKTVVEAVSAWNRRTNHEAQGKVNVNFSPWEIRCLSDMVKKEKDEHFYMIQVCEKNSNDYDECEEERNEARRAGEKYYNKYIILRDILEELKK